MIIFSSRHNCKAAYNKIMQNYSIKFKPLFVKKYIVNILYCFSDLWEVGDYCRLKQKKINCLRFEERDIVSSVQKRIKTNPVEEESNDVNSLKCMYIRSLYPKPEDLPKTKLLNWAKSHNKPLPKYHTEQFEKLFMSTVTFDNMKYSSSFWLVKQIFSMFLFIYNS